MRTCTNLNFFIRPGARVVSYPAAYPRWVGPSRWAHLELEGGSFEPSEWTRDLENGELGAVRFLYFFLDFELKSRMVQCCRCNGSGRCVNCVCVRNRVTCTNCTPSRNGRCEIQALSTRILFSHQHNKIWGHLRILRRMKCWQSPYKQLPIV